MAFKKTISTRYGFEVIDAYHRVEGVRLVSKDKIAFNLRAYKDGETAMLSHIDDSAFECAYDLQGSNPIAQAYNFLKTQPDFKNVKDC